LSEEKAVEYKTLLVNKVEEGELYKNNNLTLQDISEKLDISVHNLSQVLNNYLGQNFIDFINQYRVNAVKNKLTDKTNDHLKILTIAFDCGFNSKTSFNAIFKKYANMTPSEYRYNVRGW
jgi:AraC-like DNA-binding protein